MNNLTGKWIQVFLFSFSRYFKGKAVKIFMTVLIVLPVILVICLSSFTGKEKVSDIDTMYIIDEADTKINFEEFFSGDTVYKNVKLNMVDEKSAESFNEKYSLSEKDIMCYISFDEEDLIYNVSIYKSDDATLSLVEINNFYEEFLSFFNTSRMENVKIDNDLITVLSSEVRTSNDTIGDNSARNSASDLNMMYVVVIPIIICIMLTALPVINTVVQEKSNKIIEFMVISVSPMQMLIGKVLAALSYILVLILTCVISFLVTLFGCSIFMDNNPVKEFFSEVGLLSFFSSLGFIDIIYLLVSFIATLLFYSFLAALLGALCSRPEDASKASAPLSIFLLSGYYLTMVATSSNGSIEKFAKFFPFSASFYANYEYIKGDLPASEAIITLLIQIALVCALIFVVSKVYKNLILYNGERVQLNQLKKFWGE